jgi:hypothetical protein
VKRAGKGDDKSLREVERGLLPTELSTGHSDQLSLLVEVRSGGSRRKRWERTLLPRGCFYS